VSASFLIFINYFVGSNIFCLYVLQNGNKNYLATILIGKNTWCKATYTPVFHCPFLQDYLTVHTHIRKQY